MLTELSLSWVARQTNLVRVSFAFFCQFCKNKSTHFILFSTHHRKSEDHTKHILKAISQTSSLHLNFVKVTLLLLGGAVSLQIDLKTAVLHSPMVLDL